MKPVILALAFVHFVGLGIWEYDDEGQGTHILLPKVTADVEEHVAIIAFKPADVILPITGWTPQTLTPVSGYEYIELQGERVWLNEVSGTIIWNAASNNVTRIPAGVPSLKKSCPQMQNLRPEYQWPFTSAGAAAVSIPRSTLEACVGNNAGRIDTRITLTRKFQLRATGKGITFRDGSLVIVGNVPRSWLDGLVTDLHDGTPHSNTYFAMGAGNGTGCALEQVTNNPQCPGAPFQTAKLRPRKVLKGPALPPSVDFLTYECSNTQWP